MYPTGNLDKHKFVISTSMYPMVATSINLNKYKLLQVQVGV